MTLKVALDNFRLRMSQLMVTESLSPAEIRTLLNWSRRDLVSRMWPFYRDWFLIEDFPCGHSVAVPYNLLGSTPARVMLYDNTTLRPARYVKPNEFYTAIARDYPTRGSNVEPVFTLWARTMLTDPSDMLGVMDYWCGPDDFAIDGTGDAGDLGMPHGYDVAVVIGACLRALSKLEEKNKLATLYKDYMATVSAAAKSDGIEDTTGVLTLQSLPLQTLEDFMRQNQQAQAQQQQQNQAEDNQ